MKKIVVVNVAKLLMVTLFWSVPVSSAQDKDKPDPKPQAETQEKPIDPYRLDFTIYEIESGKKVNARQYSMNLNAGDHNTLKIGTRVPVEVKQGEMQYIDVGTNVWGGLRERENGLALEVRAEISNFAIPDQAERPNSMPILRQMQINASTVAVPGRPTIVGSVDDPNSKRQFQLEVTVTKLK
jgi:hypothetical protein